MRLEQLDFRTYAVLDYSQYLKRSDGIWCRVFRYPEGHYGFQYMYEYPAKDWEGGMWCSRQPLSALELACILQHCEPTRYRNVLPWDATEEMRVPKDHFLPWTEAELSEMMPFKITS